MCRSFLGGGHGLSKSSETQTLSWRSLDEVVSSIRHQNLGARKAQPAPQGVRTMNPSCPQSRALVGPSRRKPCESDFETIKLISNGAYG